MSNIISIGAYDRFNYGDLLFAHMIDRSAKQPVDHVSIVGAELAFVGGHNTLSINQKIKSSPKLPNVVVGGGDVLTPGWFSVLWQLQSQRWDSAFRGAYKLLPEGLLKSLSRNVYKSRWRMPFIPPAAYAQKAKVVYHAVGGATFDALAPADRSYAIRALNESAFVSVRDQETQNKLLNAGVESRLAPDSVAALYFDSAESKPVPGSENGTVAIQCSAQYSRRYGDQFADALSELIRSGRTIQFVPIGLTGGHSDLLAYRQLKARLPKLQFVTVNHVREIRDAIKTSDIFIGTSLHGHITATADRVPNIALGGIEKLDAYVNTWSEGQTPIVIDLREIPSLVELVRSPQHMERLESHAHSLADLARANTVQCLQHVES